MWVNRNEIGCGYFDFFQLAQDMVQCRVLVKTAMTIRVPYISGIYCSNELLPASQQAFTC
jgi:hypothetical protein